MLGLAGLLSMLAMGIFVDLIGGEREAPPPESEDMGPTGNTAEEGTQAEEGDLLDYAFADPELAVDGTDGGAAGLLIAGTEGQDILSGEAGDDTIDGGDGDDVLLGGSRADPFGADGGSDGVDYLNGGAGADLLMLGALDHATGGAGADTFAFGEWAAAGPATIHDYDPAEDQLVLVYDPALHPDPQLSIVPGSAEGAVYLSLDGVRLAEVTNGAGLSAGDVTLYALDSPRAA